MDEKIEKIPRIYFALYSCTIHVHYYNGCQMDSKVYNILMV